MKKTVFFLSIAMFMTFNASADIDPTGNSPVEGGKV